LITDTSIPVFLDGRVCLEFLLRRDKSFLLNVIFFEAVALQCKCFYEDCIFF